VLSKQANDRLPMPRPTGAEDEQSRRELYVNSEKPTLRPTRREARRISWYRLVAGRPQGGTFFV
jgi:hypothetical protein